MSELRERVERVWRDRAAEPASALREAAELLAEARDVGDDAVAAAALRIMAWCGSVQARFDAAREHAGEAIALARRAGDRRGEALGMTLLGTALDRIGDVTEARRLHEQALDIARAIGEETVEAIAMIGLGRILGESGEYAGAMELHERARAIAGRIGARDVEALALLGIGNAHESMASYQDALAAYEWALEIAGEIGHVQIQAYAAGNIGLVHERIGDLATARSFELRSLELKESLGDRWGVGVSLNNIGLIYSGLGDYGRALEYLLRALECAESIGDRRGEMVALHNIGHHYETLDERAYVHDYYQRVLEIAGALGDRRGEAVALGDLGRFHTRLGDNRQALLYMLRALRIHEEIDDRFGMQGALTTIAGIYQMQGESVRAAEYAGRALEVSEATGDRRGIIVSLVRLGSVVVDLGEHARAVSLLGRALALAREGEYPHDMLSAAHGLAEAYRAAGDQAGCRTYQRMYRDLAARVFSEEQALRTRGMIDRLERRRLRDKAASLGLSAEDLDALMRIESAPQAQPDATASADAPRTPAVSVATFGELRVSVDGRTLRTADWGRKKARDLFKFLLINHRRTVTLEEIIERLWQGAADRSTELVVMNAVSRIRKALEPWRGPRDRNSMLTSVDRTYRLDLGESAEIDFIGFKELIVQARAASTARERYDRYAEAAAIHTDDFLKEDYYEEWTSGERDLLKDACLEALEYMAAEQHRTGRDDEAAGTARRILAADATSERGHEILLASLMARGRTSEALAAWKECRAAFRRELDTEPPARLRGIVEMLDR